jgi:pyruvate,water dikinase
MISCPSSEIQIMSNNPRTFLYFFAAGQADAGNDLKHLVGGKGASLAEMTRAGLNVPPGFTVSAECCDLFFKAGEQWPAGLQDEIKSGLARLEKLAGRLFGQGENPLLVAVRSGAAQSMPGMMDTILNVGLNSNCVRAMAQRSGNARAIWEAYRHLLVMFAHTARGIDEAVFSKAIADFLREAGKLGEDDLDAEQAETLCKRLQETYRRQTGEDMPTDPWEQLVASVNAVFRSWNNERAVTYRRHHQVEGLLGTAVTVQIMCPAEVSGVMFTANPVNPTLDQILIESSFGLGEAIVLGKVTPDRFVVERGSLRIVEREISAKTRITATVAATGGTPARPKDGASLNDAQVAELARLGLSVENYFHFPCDIEWALSQGQFYLLQARAIKTRASGQESVAGSEGSDSAAEIEQVRREEIAALQARAEPGGTVWSRFNLSEILPEPTPMTWAIVRQFMSGRGGFGLMYRDLGFDPDPALDDDGIFDLVCGRPYCNLSREPRLQYRRLPFEHPFAVLKANPAKALYPQAVLNPARARWHFWLLLPAIFFKLIRSGSRLRRASRTFAERFSTEIVPGFVAETEQAAATDWSGLDTPALLERLGYWTSRTLTDFGRDSLKPTALAGIALGNLERALARYLAPTRPAGAQSPDASPPPEGTGMQRAQSLLRELVMGVRPDADSDLPGAIRELAEGRLERSLFLKRFGHRGSQEMEISQPRWAEDHAALDRLVGEGAVSPGEIGAAPHSAAATDEAWQRIIAEAKLSATQRLSLENELAVLRAYMSLRETAKHHLMRGYALIRRILVELDRRYQLEGGIFFLTPQELPRLAGLKPGSQDAELAGLITRRRRRREVALSLPVPQVLFSDDLEAIGRRVEVSEAEVLQGVGLSAGVAEGEALVLDRPDTQVPDRPYILVCPSTDPAWVPLFVKARGLVMETGGVLSHGAIVAREFGLPAVAGLPDVQRRLRTGQRLRVDGATGRVNVLA